MSELRAALEALDTKIAKLGERRKTAAEALQYGKADVTRHVFAPLQSLNPQRTSDERFAEATQQVLDNLRGGDYVLVPVDFAYPGKGVRVYDPARRRELDEAEQRLRDAVREKDNFLAEHGDELAAEEREQEFARVEEALASRNADALRDVLGNAPEGAPSRERVTRGA